MLQFYGSWKAWMAEGGILYGRTQYNNNNTVCFTLFPLGRSGDFLAITYYKGVKPMTDMWIVKWKEHWKQCHNAAMCLCNSIIK